MFDATDDTAVWTPGKSLVVDNAGTKYVSTADIWRAQKK
jgi:hypothetical protein